jgi:hypothetical protein
VVQAALRGNTDPCARGFAGTLSGWLLTDGAVLMQKLTILDSPEELHSVVVVKYLGDPPVADRSVIYLQAVLKPLIKVRVPLYPCASLVLSVLSSHEGGTGESICQVQRRGRP